MRRPTTSSCLRWVAALAFGVGLVAAPAASFGQVIPPPTTDPPETTAPPPTTAPATTAPPATYPPETTAPPAPTTARPAPTPTTARPAASTTTTVPPSTTTPEQLPTLPPRPDGQLVPTETTMPPAPDEDAARVSPLFPALSAGGFLVALLILVVQFLWNGRKAARR